MLLKTVIYITLFLSLFFTAELLYRYKKWKAENSRKLVHISVGILALSFCVCFDEPTPVFILCSSFLLLLLGSLKIPFLQSVNGVVRKTYGSLLYPVIVAASFWFAWYQSSWMYFYLPIAIMVFSDPLAAIVGGTAKKEGKTISGSLAFLVSAMCISFFALFHLEHLALLPCVLMSIAMGVLLTLVEYFSTKGWDNLSIPAVGMCFLFVFKNSSLWM